MSVYNLSFHLNLILTDLGLEPEPSPEAKDRASFDEAYLKTMLRQFSKVHEGILQVTTTNLLGRIAPIEWDLLFHEIALIAQEALKLPGSEKHPERFSETTLSAVHTKALHVLETSQNMLQILHTRVQEKQSSEKSYFSRFRRALVPGVSGAVGSIAFKMLNKNMMKTFETERGRLQTRLYGYTQSTIPREFAKSLSQYIVFYLQNHLVDIERRDPFLRAPFLIRLVDDMTLPSPQLNATGAVLKNLIEDYPEIIEACVTTNVLRMLVALYELFFEYRERAQDLFSSLISHIFQEVMDHTDGVMDSRSFVERHVLEARLYESFVSGRLQEEAVQFFFQKMFPKGAEDLLLPDIGVAGALFRETIWGVLREAVMYQMKLTIRSFGREDTLKKAIVTIGLESAQNVLQTGSLERAKRSSPLLEDLLASEYTFTGLGVIFVFFRSFLSAALRSILQVFQCGEAIEHELPYQHEASDEMLKFLNEIEGKTSSTMLRMFLGRKKEEIAILAGRWLIQGVSHMNLLTSSTQHLNLFLTNFLAPGGVWSGEGEERIYTPLFSPIPTVQEELTQRKLQSEAERRELDGRYKRAQKSFGRSVEGLIEMIYASFALKGPGALTESASKFDVMVHQAEALAIDCVNALLRQVLSWSFWLFDVRNVLQEVRQITEERADRAQQDFLFISALSALRKYFA